MNDNNNNSKISTNANILNSSNDKIESIKQNIIYNSKQLEKELFFQKNYGDRETLFYVSLPSFKKSLEQKNETDNKIISLYLNQMKKFVELLKKVSSNNSTNSNEKNINSDDFIELINKVSTHILYLYMPASRILMRYGDEGEKFYILLNGTVTIIVPRKKSVNISLNEYYRYIALLIIYKEQQILKQVVRENKNANYLEIPGIDYFFVLSNDENPLILMRNIYLNRIYKKKYSNQTLQNFNNDKLNKIFDKKKMKRRNSDFHKKKLNFKQLENEYKKVEDILYTYLTEEEMLFYHKSLIEEKYDIFEIDDDNVVSPEQYVKRIQNYKYSRDIIKNKEVENKEEKLGLVTTNDKFVKLFIYEYNILVELNSGDMFGEAALSAPSLKRNATIMTVTDCHFGCLNRKIYKKHIQKATETNKKNIINYICSTGIFNKFPKEIMSKKFFSTFVFKKNKKNDLLIKQKEINNNVILTKEGIYEIIFNGSLYDIYNLINIYHNNLLTFDKKNDVQNEEINNKINKMKEQEIKIQKFIGNEIHKIEEFKILLIDSPSTFGLKETEEKITVKDKAGNISYHYMSYYDVKCNSTKSEYIIIDKNAFYKQIYATEYTVQESSKCITRQFITKIINRLLNIRLGKIYNILLMRGFNKDSKNIFYDKNNTEIHNNLNFNYSKDFYERISLLIDNCDENKFSTSNLEEYIYNYFEKKREKDLKEKREFKNRKEKFKKSSKKRKLFTGGNKDFSQITNIHKKNLSLNRISSAINNRTKLTLFKDNCIQKDRNQYLASAKTKIAIKSNAKNKRSQTKFRDTYSPKLNFSPKLTKKINDFHLSKMDIKNPSIKSVFYNKLKNRTYKPLFQEAFLSISKINDYEFNHVNPNEENKYTIHTIRNNNHNKINILGVNHMVPIPKIFLNKSKSAYEIKSKNQQNFINNRRNYVINITRSFFTKNKDFNRTIRIKSS